MKYPDSGPATDLDCLLIFVPKFKNFYRPIGEHMFTVLLPMGLIAMADLIHKKGYKVQILHLGLEKINNPNFSLGNYLAKANPKIAGFSLHWHYQSHDTIEAAREVKLFNPDIFTVLGGLTASYFHKEIIGEFDFIDAVIKGDGELSFLKLLEDVRAGKNNFSEIPNLTWRFEGGVKINDITYVAGDEDLDKLNFTNFKLLKNHELYLKMQDMRGARWSKGISTKIFSKFGPPAYFPLLISKGCLVSCSYCGGARLSQLATCGRRNVSVRSIPKVIESIGEAREYGFKEIYISYLPFNDHPDYFEELFENIKLKDIRMNYFLECWALPPESVINAFNRLRSDNFKLHIGISPETGSENIRRLNKGFYYSNDELTDRLELIGSLNIPVLLYFSFGMPFETPEDIKSTLHFQDDLRKRFKNIISISTTSPALEPASPMFLDPEKYGIVKARNSFKDFIQSSGDMNKEGFLTPKLGYFMRDFCKPYRRLSDEESFRRNLQGTICGSSCRIAEFLFPGFLKLDSALIKKSVFFCSRLICNAVSSFWKICYRGKGLKGRFL